MGHRGIGDEQLGAGITPRRLRSLRQQGGGRGISSGTKSWSFVPHRLHSQHHQVQGPCGVGAKVYCRRRVGILGTQVPFLVVSPHAFVDLDESPCLLPITGAGACQPPIPSSVTRSFLFLRAENYWWRGQNKRTLKVGQFPRNTVTSVAGLSAHDISQPLKNSFIHTGHGDTNPQHCWGFPDKIDE